MVNLTRTSISIWLCLVFISFSNFAFAQKINEGVVEFDITYPNLTEEQKANTDLFPKSMAIFFKGQKCRIELYTIMGTTVILSDYESKETFVLNNMMGKKIAMKSTAESMRKLEEENKLKNPVSVKLNKKTKTIAGYSCKGAEITSTNNDIKSISQCYYSTELPNVNYSVTSDMKDKIDGMMLEYEMITAGIQMHIKANNVKLKSIIDEAFTVPADFEILESQETK